MNNAPASGHRQVGGEDRFVVHLDQDGVVAGAFETQLAELVDQVDAVQRGFGLELAV